MQVAIDFAAADRRAETGMRRSAERAERVDPGWVHLAIATLAEYARTATKPFTIEQARAVIGNTIPVPANLRAWGIVTKASLKQKIIVPVGSDRAASSNGSPKTTYRAGQGAA